MKRSSRKWKKKNKSGYRGRWKWYRKKLKERKRLRKLKRLGILGQS
ncbi:MAG: hypothetical protein ACP5IJ_02000 [Candidatus Nanoarchaeia archaeon]